MRLIKKHDLDELVLTRVLGWKWMSWIDIPERGTPGYPRKMRVRQLLSPKQLKDPKWIRLLEERDARDADGTEPFSYAYGSSAGPAQPPRIMLLVDE